MDDTPSWKCVCEVTLNPQTINPSLNVSCTTGVGEQALDTKDSDWMLLRLLLQLASTHLSWTGEHSCPSLCRHGLGLPWKHPIPEHQWSSLYSYLTWKTSSCMTLNDRGGVRKCGRDTSSLEPSSVASLQKWDWNLLSWSLVQRFLICVEYTRLPAVLFEWRARGRQGRLHPRHQ